MFKFDMNLNFICSQIQGLIPHRLENFDAAVPLAAAVQILRGEPSV